jgi:hypothetical protein
MNGNQPDKRNTRDSGAPFHRLTAFKGDGHTHALQVTVKLPGFLIVAFSITGACAAAPFADPATATAELAPATAVPAAPEEDIVVEVGQYVPVTSWERLQWFGVKTFGVSNLGGGLPVAAWLTFLDRPHDAGPHWEGFGERYGVSVSTSAVSNTMEAGLGAIWGEDPRYLRVGTGVPFKARLGRVVKWTVLAPGRDGELRPAYARFIAISSSSFISNAWREPDDTNVEHSLRRIGFSLLGRMASDAFFEFWPDAKRKVFHHAR